MNRLNHRAQQTHDSESERSPATLTDSELRNVFP